MEIFSYTSCEHCTFEEATNSLCTPFATFFTFRFERFLALHPPGVAGQFSQYPGSAAGDQGYNVSSRATLMGDFLTAQQMQYAQQEVSVSTGSSFAPIPRRWFFDFDLESQSTRGARLLSDEKKGKKSAKWSHVRVGVEDSPPWLADPPPPK